LLGYDRHQGVQRLTKDLNNLYRSEAAMHDLDFDPKGFEWRLQDSAEASVLAHERISESGERVLVVSNFTPVPHEHFRLGVPAQGKYSLLLNTDSTDYAGSGFEVKQTAEIESVESEGLDTSIELRLPPLSTIFYKLN
jgi:1,4-alpha-glucan branching enzyme